MTIKKVFSGSMSVQLLIGALLFPAGVCTPTTVRAANPAGIITSAAVVAGVLAGGRAVYNYAELRRIQMKGRTEHILFGDSEQSEYIKIYNWKRAQWPSARTILDNREAVKRELCSAIVNKEIVIFDKKYRIIE
jgi:hypothetical protein